MTNRNRTTVDRRRIKGGDLDPVYIAGGLVGIGAADTGSVDAFGRWRVSNPTSQAASQNEYDTGPIFWDEAITGGTVTHLPSQSSVRLRLTGPNQSVLRQYRQYVHYQPGKSQNPTMTFVPTGHGPGITIEVGYGDDSDGIFYQVVNDTPTLTLRSSASGSVVDNSVPQGLWSGDNLDGNGLSGITLNEDASQIFNPDFEWLGAGQVRIFFDIDGSLVKLHEFNNANINDSVYMRTANLPWRYKITSDGTVGAGTYDLIQICGKVTSEGGTDSERGIPFGTSNGVTTISVTTRRPILSFRPRATFNGITNRGLIVPESFEAYSQSENILLELVYGGVLTGATWSNVSTAHSIVEHDVAATAITGGITIGRPTYIPASSVGANVVPAGTKQSLVSKLPLALTIAGAHPTTPFTDSLSLVATSVSGAATDTGGAFGWREIR